MSPRLANILFGKNIPCLNRNIWPGYLIYIYDQDILVYIYPGHVPTKFPFVNSWKSIQNLVVLYVIYIHVNDAHITSVIYWLSEVLILKNMYIFFSSTFVSQNTYRCVDTPNWYVHRAHMWSAEHWFQMKTHIFSTLKMSVFFFF